LDGEEIDRILKGKPLDQKDKGVVSPAPTAGKTTRSRKKTGILQPAKNVPAK
jgi:hypothetical protein